MNIKFYEIHTHTYLHDLQCAYHRITIHKFSYVTSGITRILYLGYFSIMQSFTFVSSFRDFYNLKEIY